MKTQALTLLAPEAAAKPALPLGFRTLTVLIALAVVFAVQAPFLAVAASIIS